MSFYFYFFLSIGVTADSIVLGKTKLSRYGLIFLITASTHVFLFSIGLNLGSHFTSLMSNWDHWITMAVFFYLGINAAKNIFKEHDLALINRLKTIPLVIIALAMDALAVSATVSNLIVNKTLILVMIFISSLFFCYLGFFIKHNYLKISHKGVHILECFLFFGLGIKIVFSHLIGGY